MLILGTPCICSADWESLMSERHREREGKREREKERERERGTGRERGQGESERESQSESESEVKGIHFVSQHKKQYKDALWLI